MTAERLRPMLIGIALALGALAPVAGSPYGSRARLDAVSLADVVLRGDHRIEPLAVAAWIRDRLPALRVIAIPPVSAPEAGPPGAEWLPLGALVQTAFAPDETVVLLSDDAELAGQAWTLVNALGHTRVFILRGGVAGWVRDVMQPTIARDATPEQRSAFERVADISRYFGGMPRIGDVTVQAPPMTPRRGCGCGC